MSFMLWQYRDLLGCITVLITSKLFIISPSCKNVANFLGGNVNSFKLSSLMIYSYLNIRILKATGSLVVKIDSAT